MISMIVNINNNAEANEMTLNALFTRKRQEVRISKITSDKNKNIEINL